MGQHPPLARSHRRGGRGVPSRRWSLTGELLQGSACPIGAVPPAGGRGVPPKRWSLPGERLRGTASPIAAVPPAVGTGCPTQVVVAAWRAPAGDDIPHWRGRTGWGDRVSPPGGGPPMCGMWCGVVWCGVPKALLPKGKGRDVYQGAKVNGRGCVCCVRTVCRCVVAQQLTSAISHLAGTARPTPVRSHTGSHWSSAPCVPRCTISAFCVVPHCLVPCTALHCVCAAALLLWAEGSGQCNALPRRLMDVGSGTPASHYRFAKGQWVVELLTYTAFLTWGLGPGNSCNALPHHLEAVGSATPAIRYLTARGQ